MSINDPSTEWYAAKSQIIRVLILPPHTAPVSQVRAPWVHSLAPWWGLYRWDNDLEKTAVSSIHHKRGTFHKASAECKVRESNLWDRPLQHQQIASLFSTGQILFKTSPWHIKNRQKHAMKLAEGITESLVFQDKAIRESADANQLVT